MKKSQILLFICIICITLTSCGKSKISYESEGKIELFKKVVQDLMDYDTELNDDMRNIGVCFEDTSVSDNEIDQLIDKLTPFYTVPVIRYDYDKKQDDKMGTNNNKVVLIVLKVIEVRSQYVKIACLKAGAEYGAVGYTAYYQFKDNEWVLNKTEYNWLS